MDCVSLLKEISVTRKWNGLLVLKTEPDKYGTLPDEGIPFLIAILNARPPPKAVRLLKPLIVLHADILRDFNSTNLTSESSKILDRLCPRKTEKQQHQTSTHYGKQRGEHPEKQLHPTRLLDVERYAEESANRTRRHRGFRVRSVPFNRNPRFTTAFRSKAYMNKHKRFSTPKYTLANVAKRLNIKTDCSTKPSITAVEVIANIVKLCDVSLSSLGE